MGLKESWERYQDETLFNYSILPIEIKEKGKMMTYPPKKFIVSRGEFPRYMYFILSGTAMGSRNYADGNEYNYFSLDHNNGNIGLLEVFSRKDEYVATVISVSELIVVRMESWIIYDYVMSNMEMMRRCITLVSQDLYKRSGNDGLFYYLDGLNRVRYYFADYYNTHQKESAGSMIVDAEYRDIATNVGISVRTVGRSIRQLKDNGEILSKNKKVILTKEKYHLLLANMKI